MEIDLNDFADRINKRSIFLETVASSIEKQEIFSSAEVRLIKPGLQTTAEVYYLLSQAYKDIRLDGKPDPSHQKLQQLLQLRLVSSDQIRLFIHKIFCCRTHITPTRFLPYLALR